MSKKKNILFVGSFKKNSKDGNVGGQMFACNTLVNSKLKDKVNWVLIDTTASTNKHRNIKERLNGALNRLSRFMLILFSKKIDIVLLFSAHGFSFLEKGLMALIAKLFRKSVVFAPRSGYIITDTEQSNLRRRFIKLIFRSSDRIICQSETWQNCFFNIAGEADTSKYCVIQNWIDVAPYLIHRVPQRLNTVNVLFLAEVSKSKGILDLIIAADNLKSELPQNIYHIAGDGEALEESKALVKEKGLENQFVFHGWVKGKRKLELLSTANIFVLPSHFEGLPNSLIEAMASALTVISTNVGSIPDVVRDGTNGLLYDKGNIAALIQKIKQASRNTALRENLSQNARQTILENNLLDVAVTKFEKLFQKL